jgi:hypothetical protein
MQWDAAPNTSIRTLLNLPDTRGALFDEEMERTRGRIEAVHRAPVSYETEPAGAPRLLSPDA